MCLNVCNTGKSSYFSEENKNIHLNVKPISISLCSTVYGMYMELNLNIIRIPSTCIHIYFVLITTNDMNTDNNS